MFRNLQIRSKLGAILVLPLVALIVFASLQVGSSISQRTQANRSNCLTHSRLGEPSPTAPAMRGVLAGATHALDQPRRRRRTVVAALNAEIRDRSPKEP